MDKIKKGETVFEPVGDTDNLIELALLIRSVKNKADSLRLSCQTTDAVDEQVDRKLKESKEHYDKIVDFFKDKWGKFLNLEFSHNVNGNWVVSHSYDIMPYRYTPSNGLLWGLIHEVGDRYTSGLKDSNINLREMTIGSRLTIREITRDDFLNGAITSVGECMENRLGKMYSEDYECDKFGYKCKLNTKYDWNC